MIASKLRMIATIAGAIGFCSAMGFAIAFGWAETRLMDGMRQNVVRYEMRTARMRGAYIDFLTDAVPHRIVSENGAGIQVVECRAIDLAWRLALIYAVGGAIIGVASVLGANPSRIVATGLITLVLFLAMVILFVQHRHQVVPFAAGIVGLSIMIACGESMHSAYTSRERTRISPLAEV